ncbi:MAG: aldo/keto reductase [Chloroflexi bacterium]|nr:aldo/keto reductase [Chloroflexota bacterium]
MRYRQLGSTDIMLSEVGFGCWTLSTGWWGKVSDAEAVRLLRRAHDLGVTFYDSSDSYGNGRSERQLAAAFKGRRGKVVIATKFGYDWYRYAGERRGQQEIPQDWSPRHIRFACEESLKRLDTDYIDIYQMHNPKLDALAADAAFEALERLKAEGKVRCYGVALGPAIGWREEGLRALGERPIAMLQIIHNLLEQDPGRDLIAAARQRGVGVIVRVPHSSGMLEGRYTKDTTFEPGDHRSHRTRAWLDEGLQKIERLRFLTEGRGRTLGQAALRWLCAEPAIACALPNIYDEGQLVEFAGASDCPDLTAEELARVADLYGHNFHLQKQPARA